MQSPQRAILKQLSREKNGGAKNKSQKQVSKGNDIHLDFCEECPMSEESNKIGSLFRSTVCGCVPIS
jgi:hypothetical protein